MKYLAGMGIGLVAIVLWLVSSYNGLVGLNAEVDASWAQVETQYQRRFDLIPNLVEATKGTLRQEQEVFTAIAEARQGYAGASTQAEKVAQADKVESALARLLVIMENYPTLQSNQTILALMDELAGTENRVSVERNRYNEVAKTFNTRIKSVPTVFMATYFGFKERPYFESVAAAEQAPKVDLQVAP